MMLGVYVIWGELPYSGGGGLWPYTPLTLHSKAEVGVSEGYEEGEGTL